MYAALPEERFPVPAVNLSRVDSQYYRRVVEYRTEHLPGTVIVDTPHRYLYFVMQSGRAMRYGIGVGKVGFVWNGTARIAAKRPWPTWTPPKEMIEREPDLEKYAKGMPPGLDNPLGARALYIYKNGQDTLYRLHGTSEAHTIGKAVSSGCIRLLHQDVIDLYERVRPGAKIVVLEHARMDLRLSSKFLRDVGESISKRISEIRREL
jgi:lipoprotein-anchoring transpeptidase ErfK/SrfK